MTTLETLKDLRTKMHEAHNSQPNDNKAVGITIAVGFVEKAIREEERMLDLEANTAFTRDTFLTDLTEGQVDEYIAWRKSWKAKS